MSEVEALVQEARRGLDAGQPMATLVQELGEAPNWKVDAAYAYTRRRDVDPEFQPVADLFEVTIAWRERHVLRGPRWWHHFEVVVGLAGVFMLAYTAMLFAPVWEEDLGWWSAVWTVAYLAIFVGMFKFGRDLTWLVEDRDQHLTHHALGIVDEMDEIIRDAPSLDAAAERTRRLAVQRPDEVSQWLASFALANVSLPGGRTATQTAADQDRGGQPRPNTTARQNRSVCTRGRMTTTASPCGGVQ